MKSLRYLLTLFLTLNLSFAAPGDLQKSIEKSVQNYNLAKNSYLKTGPEGFLKYADFLNRQDRIYLKAQLSKLPQLPDLEVAENSFKIKYQNNSFKIDVFYEDSIILGLPNGHKISMTPKRSLETISNEIQKGLEISKVHFEIIPSANAELSTMMAIVLGLVGGFAGYWIYNSFFAAKPSTNSGQVHKITVTDLPHGSPTGGGGGEAAGDKKSENDNSQDNKNKDKDKDNENNTNPSNKTPQGGPNPSNGQPSQGATQGQGNQRLKKEDRELLQKLFCSKIGETPNKAIFESLLTDSVKNPSVGLGQHLAEKYNGLLNPPDDLEKKGMRSAIQSFYNIFLDEKIGDNKIDTIQMDSSSKKIINMPEATTAVIQLHKPLEIKLICPIIKNEAANSVGCDTKNLEIRINNGIRGNKLCSIPPPKPKPGANTPAPPLGPTPPQLPNGAAPAPTPTAPAPNGGEPTPPSPNPPQEIPD